MTLARLIEAVEAVDDEVFQITLDNIRIEAARQGVSLVAHDLPTKQRVLAILRAMEGRDG